MRRLKHGLALAALVAVSAFGLYGCGGDSPTATVVSATATTATSTEPTATTATTGGTGATEPTATTATTSGTGGSGSAVDLLTNSANAMKGVKSYHIVLKSDAAGASTTGEGDFVLPDKARLTMNASGTSSEIIIIGTTTYTKIPGGDSYLETPGSVNLLAQSTDTAAFASLAQDATVVGDETIDGVDTTHVKFSYDADKAAAQAGAPSTGTTLGTVNADEWIEKSTGYMHQFSSVSTVAGVQSTTTITFSKFNEDVSPPIEKPTNIQQMPSIPTVPSP